MSRANRKPPKHKPVPQRPVPDGSWRGMSPERIRQASTALACGSEDVTDEEREALDEYILLGGNVWGL